MTRGELEEWVLGQCLREANCSNKPARRDMLKELLGNRALKAAELETACGLTVMAVHNFLNKMIKKGWVRKVEGQRGRYEMIPEKKEWLAGFIKQAGTIPEQKIPSYPEITLSVGGKTTTILFKSEVDLVVAVRTPEKIKKSTKGDV